MTKQAFLFPGQGSQVVGMGRDLAAAFAVAAAVFEEVDEALGQHLSRLMFEGPSEELTLTSNAQPALMAASVAVWRVLQHEGGLDLATHAAYVAGHSLGEYSALAAAGAISVAETARLLRIRGDAMQAAVPAGQGAMAALIGVEHDAVSRWCAEVSESCAPLVVQPANDNGGGQVVISGDREAVERAMDLAKEQGVRRAVLLAVSAPFHCSLMAPAARAMRDALQQVTIGRPAVPVVANVTARPVSDPDVIRDVLEQQVTGTVRWRESMDFMVSEGVDSFVELGAGKVLAGLARRIAPDARVCSVGSPDDVEAFLKTL